MARIIFKYQMDGGEIFKDFILPAGAKFLHVGLQHGMATFWYQIDTSQPEETVQIFRVGTGWPLTVEIDQMKYLGSIIDGAYVWHFYQRRPNGQKASPVVST